MSGPTDFELGLGEDRADVDHEALDALAADAAEARWEQRRDATADLVAGSMVHALDRTHAAIAAAGMGLHMPPSVAEWAVSQLPDLMALRDEVVAWRRVDARHAPDEESWQVATARLRDVIDRVGGASHG